jgi:solute carrier family 31 (copper transporter), member 1
MLFTWDTSNLCIVFRQWHITSNLSLVVSLAAIVAICAGYEALREATRRYEAKLSKRVEPRKLLYSLPLPTPIFLSSPARTEIT